MLKNVKYKTLFIDIANLLAMKARPRTKFYIEYWYFGGKGAFNT